MRIISLIRYLDLHNGQCQFEMALILVKDLIITGCYFFFQIFFDPIFFSSSARATTGRARLSEKPN